jgi:hypothetical protein
MSRSLVVLAAAAMMTTVTPGPLLAQEAGHIKVARGEVQSSARGRRRRPRSARSCRQATW